MSRQSVRKVKHTSKFEEFAAHKLQRGPESSPLVTPTPEKILSPPQTLPKLTANGKIRGRPRKSLTDAVSTPKPVSSIREEILRLRTETTDLKIQLEQKNKDFEELKRQTSYTGQTVPKSDFDDLTEKYTRDITHAKRHEWCVVCLTPSRYYCCWNTTYCSQKCQVSDWYNRHMRVCERRKTVKQ